MQAVATWLVARPLNAILGLAATASPYLGFLSSMLIVLFVLRQGGRIAAFEAAMAGLLVAVVSLAVGSPVTVVAFVAIVYWLPAYLLASLLAVSRSLTLSLQVSVLVTVLAMVAFFVTVGDATAFWDRQIELAATEWRKQGANQVADWAVQNREQIATQATMSLAIFWWTIYAAATALGYAMYRQLPGETVHCGLFRDLSFGRVIAVVMAICSIVALLSGAIWLQNLAFVLFAVFWLQGLAIIHWLHGHKMLPAFAVVVVYVLLLPLSAVVVIALSVLGYIDAWFRLRRKAAV